MIITDHKYLAVLICTKCKIRHLLYAPCSCFSRTVHIYWCILSALLVAQIFKIQKIHCKLPFNYMPLIVFHPQGSKCEYIKTYKNWCQSIWKWKYIHTDTFTINTEGVCGFQLDMNIIHQVIYMYSQKKQKNTKQNKNKTRKSSPRTIRKVFPQRKAMCIYR